LGRADEREIPMTYNVAAAAGVRTVLEKCVEGSRDRGAALPRSIFDPASIMVG
jgi:hypothetical protein